MNNIVSKQFRHLAYLQGHAVLCKRYYIYSRLYVYLNLHKLYASCEFPELCYRHCSVTNHSTNPNRNRNYRLLIYVHLFVMRLNLY